MNTIIDEGCKVRKQKIVLRNCEYWGTDHVHTIGVFSELCVTILKF